MKSMTEGRPIALILSFSLPLLLGNLLQQIYNIADALIVGNILGGDALASVGASGGIQFLVLGFCIGLCSGFGVLIANSFGARDFSEMRRYIFTSLLLGTLMALVITVFFSLLCPFILHALNVPGEIYDDAFNYLLVIFLGIPATILYNLTASVLRAVGDSRTPFIFLTVSTLLNVVLDYIFVRYFGWRVIGAAVATVLSQALSGLLCALYIKKKTALFEFEENEKKLEKKRIGALLLQGVPMGLQFSFTALGIVIMQAANNALGTVYITAMTASLRIKQFLLCPFDALGVSVSTFIAQNDGAGKKRRIKRGFISGLSVGLIYGLIAGGAMVVFGGALTGLFVNGDKAEVVKFSSMYLGSIGIFFWVLPLLIISRNALQGLGHSLQAVFAGVVELVARAIICFFIVPQLGFSAICFADQTAWITGTLYIFPLFLFVLAKTLKNAEESESEYSKKT